MTKPISEWTDAELRRRALIAATPREEQLAAEVLRLRGAISEAWKAIAAWEKRAGEIADERDRYATLSDAPCKPGCPCGRKICVERRRPGTFCIEDTGSNW